MRVQGKRIWIAGQFMPAQLVIREGKIEKILPYGQEAADIDWGEKRVLPGFIDVHTHGAYGYDTNDGTPEGLREWMRRIPQEGVTSILPTTVTQMPDVLERAVVMQYFDQEKNERINQMWVNVRCFDLTSLTWKDWAVIGAAAVIAAAAVVMFKKRDEIGEILHRR